MSSQNTACTKHLSELYLLDGCTCMSINLPRLNETYTHNAGFETTSQHAYFATHYDAKSGAWFSAGFLGLEMHFHYVIIGLFLKCWLIVNHVEKNSAAFNMFSRTGKEAKVEERHASFTPFCSFCWWGLGAWCTTPDEAPMWPKIGEVTFWSNGMGSCQNCYFTCNKPLLAWVQGKMEKWTWHGWWSRPSPFSSLMWFC